MDGDLLPPPPLSPLLLQLGVSESQCTCVRPTSKGHRRTRPPTTGLREHQTSHAAPSDLEHSKGIDSQGPSRLRTLLDPSIVAASRPPAAAPKLVQQRVTKTKKDNSRPPISSTTTISGAAPSRRPLISQSRTPAHPGRKLVQSIV
jgi:hypothetical protein